MKYRYSKLPKIAKVAGIYLCKEPTKGKDVISHAGMTTIATIKKQRRSITTSGIKKMLLLKS